MPRAARLVETPRMLYLFRRLQLATYARMEKDLRSHAVTPTEYMVMSSLAFRGESSSAQLSRRFRVRPQSMIKLVLNLEARGFVQRSARENDKRTLEISLTDSGAAALAQCDTIVDAIEADVLADLGAEDRLHFRRYVQSALDRARADKAAD
jgi:DNA-binding MarR family transcriptional regulator